MGSHIVENISLFTFSSNLTRGTDPFIESCPFCFKMHTVSLHFKILLSILRFIISQEKKRNFVTSGIWTLAFIKRPDPQLGQERKGLSTWVWRLGPLGHPANETFEKYSNWGKERRKRHVRENNMKNTPRRGIEPWSSAWQAGILTTILPRPLISHRLEI